MSYSNKIRSLRTDSGMSQEQLASQLCVTRQTVSKWEQGINQPDIDTIKKLAKIFGVTADEIIGMSPDVDDTPDEPAQKTKLKRTNGTLFWVNMLFALFCVVAAVILWRMAMVTRTDAFDLGVRQNNSPTKFNDDIVLLYHNTDALYFVPAFVLFAGEAALCRFGCKNYFKAQVVALSITLATQIGMCATMFSITLLRASFVDLTDVVVFVTCLFADLLAVVGLACHPKLLPQNEILGFRTNFTLGNLTAWRKVNTLFSILFSSCCAVCVALELLIPNINIWMAVALLTTAVVAAIIPCTIYHELLRKNLQNR